MEPTDHREEMLDSWLALTGKGPSVDHALLLPVLSGSMLPDFPPDSILQIDQSAAKHCRVGDVVVYQDGDRLIAHRLLFRLGFGTRSVFFEKGDANTHGSWIKAHRIKGLVTGIIKQEGQSPAPVRGDQFQAGTSLVRLAFHRIMVLPRMVKKICSAPGKD